MNVNYFGLSKLRGILGFDNEEEKENINSLANNYLIKLADEINAIFSCDDSVITLPRIVVVGTQSSGKSSVLNGLMRMELLPTGSNMTTRTPLDIRMSKTEGETASLTIGSYENGVWIEDLTVDLELPEPSKTKIDIIRKQIMKKTDQLAGEGFDVSPIPIVLKIESPNVPNLSLTDLPGIIMLSENRTTKLNQKKQIEDMITQYLFKERAIILSVIQAREDIQADPGFAFIKEQKLNANKILGILTKPDLMNSGTHVGRYLSNDIKDYLKVSEGYFCVKNKSKKDQSVLESFDDEKDYFCGHKEYYNSYYSNKTGIEKVSKKLSLLLIEETKNILPSAIDDINNLANEVTKKLKGLGEGAPESDESKLSTLHMKINHFNVRFNSLLEDRGVSNSMGRFVKEIFDKFRKEITELHPFSDLETYPNNYFLELIKNFEGNHMSHTIPHIEILEKCVTDKKKRPILILKECTQLCVERIFVVLRDTIDQVLESVDFSKFPPLKGEIRKLAVDKLIAPTKTLCHHEIYKFLEMEESYIWSDNEQFKKFFNDIGSKPVANEKNYETLRKMLDLYFDDLKEKFAHVVPKIIMMNMIRSTEENLFQYLYNILVKENRIDLVKETDEIAKTRKYYKDLDERLTYVRRELAK